MARKKIAVIGAGRVGEHAVHSLLQKNLGDIVLVDIVEGKPQGIALDLMEERPLSGWDMNVIGTTDYKDIEGADVVVMTAGFPRKPGMSRDDLIEANIKIVKPAAENIKKYAPNATVIVVTNPLDVMCWTMYKVTGFPKNRVMGMAGVLDTVRFRTFIAMEMGVSVKDVQAYVLGGHGDDMVPLVRYSNIGGIPLEEIMPKDKIDFVVKRTRGAGGEIVKLLGYSAYFSPGHSVADMVQAILLDEKRVLPASAYLEGEYGFEGIFLGVPILLGAGGVEKVFELKLTDEEKAALTKSANGVKEVTNIAAQLLDKV